MNALRELLGVYEKSLPAHEEWAALFAAVAVAGFDFLELSIDESTERLSRLNWSEAQRQSVSSAAQAAGVRVGAVALSAHRGHPLGHSDFGVRQRALELGIRTIQLAADLGAPLVQLAGYFTFYAPWHRDARSYFVDGLAQCAEYARRTDIRLAIENVDGRDVTCIRDGLSLIADAQADDVVGMYIDVGNCVGNGVDPVAELRQAGSAAWAVQLKEARLGEFRRVPFGAGAVPWRRVFAQLARQRYDGPLSIEMWNDEGDPELAAAALAFLRNAGLGR